MIDQQTVGATGPVQEQYDVNTFATMIRDKFPGSYDDVDDTTLTNSVLEKYPQYQGVVTLEPVKKKDQGAPIVPVSSPLDGTESSLVSPQESEAESISSDTPERIDLNDAEQRRPLRIDPVRYGNMYQRSTFGAMQGMLEPYRDVLGEEADEIIRGVSVKQIKADDGMRQMSSIIAQHPDVMEQMGLDIATKHEHRDPYNPDISLFVARDEAEVMRDRERAVYKELQRGMYDDLAGAVTSVIPEEYKADKESLEYVEQYLLEEYGAMVDLTEEGRVGNTPFLEFEGFETRRAGDMVLPLPKFSGYLVDKFEAAGIDLVNGFINFFSSGNTIRERREKAEEIRRTTLQFTEPMMEGSFTNALMQSAGYLSEATPIMSVTLPAAVATSGLGLGPLATAGLIATESASVMTLQEAARLRENPQFSIYLKDGKEYSYNEMMMATGGDPELMLKYKEDRNVSGKAGYLANVFGSSFVADGATSLLFLKALKGVGPYGPVQPDMARWWRYHSASAGFSVGAGGATTSLAAMQQFIAQKDAVGEEYTWGEVREVGFDALVQGGVLGGAISTLGSTANIALARDPFGRQNRNMEFVKQEQYLMRMMLRTTNETELAMLTRQMDELQMRNANRLVQDQQWYSNMNPEDLQTLVDIGTQQNIKYRELLKIGDPESPMAKQLADEIEVLGRERNNIESLYEAEKLAYPNLDDDGNPFAGVSYEPPTNPEFFRPIDPLPLRGPREWYESLVDMYDSPRMIQKVIQERKGERVPLDQDIDVALRLVESKTAARLEQARQVRNEAGGMIPTLRNANKMVTKDIGGASLLPEGVEATATSMFDRYLYAMHAPERNMHVAKKHQTELNKLLAKDEADLTPAEKKRVAQLEGYIRDRNGSGMSDGDAAAYLDALDPTLRAEFEKAHTEMKRIQQDTRDALRDYGLIDEGMFNYLNTAFDNYVPLHGRSLDEGVVIDGALMTDDVAYPNVPARMKIHGDMIQEATGRAGETGDILGKVIQQNANVHIVGQKNLALQKFYNLLEANPDPNAWTLSNQGNVENPNTLVLYENGEPRYINMNDASLIRHMKESDPKAIDWLRKNLLEGARTLSNVRKFFVNYNPTFGITAFPRDVQTALVHAISQAERDFGYVAKAEDGSPINPALLAQKTAEFVPNAVRMAASNEFGGGRKVSRSDQRLYEEFKANGGQTGWAFMEPLRDIQKRLARETDPNKRFDNGLQWMKDNSVGLIESMNNVYENSVRFAAYRAAREQGVAPEYAAAMAKYSTVDFNRRGTAAPWVGALKFFFNPAIQGVDQSIGALREGKGRTKALIGGAIGFGAMLTAFNQMVSEEDDTGRSFYDKIPAYERHRNYVFMMPGVDENGQQGYVTIPKPYGYGFFEDFGGAMLEVGQGKRSPASGAMFVGESAIQNFNPINVGKAEDDPTEGERIEISPILKGLSTIDWLAPVIEVSENRTSFGYPIVYDRGGSAVGNSRIAPEGVRRLFETFNELGGGTEDVSGDIAGFSTDYNPDLGYYLLKAYLGGSANFVEQGLQTARDFRTLKASDWPNLTTVMDVDNIPLVRNFYSDGNEREVMRAYYTMRDRMEGYRDEFRDPQKIAEYAKLSVPDRDRILDEADPNSEQFRYLAYLATRDFQGKIDEMLKNPGIKNVREDNIKKIRDLDATAFSSDSTLAEYSRLVEQKEDFDALIMTLMGTYLAYAYKLMPENR